MFKNKILSSLILVSLFGCKFDYDSGSSSTSFSFGNPVSLACFKNNISHIKNLSVTSETDSKIELSSSGIKSIIEFKNENSMVTSYSIKTTTERVKDSGVHKAIESEIKAKCLE